MRRASSILHPAFGSRTSSKHLFLLLIFLHISILSSCSFVILLFVRFKRKYNRLQKDVVAAYNNTDEVFYRQLHLFRVLFSKFPHSPRTSYLPAAFIKQMLVVVVAIAAIIMVTTHHLPHRCTYTPTNIDSHLSLCRRLCAVGKIMRVETMLLHTLLFVLRFLEHVQHNTNDFRYDGTAEGNVNNTLSEGLVWLLCLSPYFYRRCLYSRHSFYVLTPFRGRFFLLLFSDGVGIE